MRHFGLCKITFLSLSLIHTNTHTTHTHVCLYVCWRVRVCVRARIRVCVREREHMQSRVSISECILLSDYLWGRCLSFLCCMLVYVRL